MMNLLISLRHGRSVSSKHRLTSHRTILSTTSCRRCFSPYALHHRPHSLCSSQRPRAITQYEDHFYYTTNNIATVHRVLYAPTTLKAMQCWRPNNSCHYYNTISSYYIFIITPLVYFKTIKLFYKIKMCII